MEKVVCEYRGDGNTRELGLMRRNSCSLLIVTHSLCHIGAQQFLMIFIGSIGLLLTYWLFITLTHSLTVVTLLTHERCLEILPLILPILMSSWQMS